MKTIVFLSLILCFESPSAATQSELIEELNQLMLVTWSVKDQDADSQRGFAKSSCELSMVPKVVSRYERLKRAKEIIDSNPALLDVIKKDNSAKSLHLQARLMEEILEAPIEKTDWTEKMKSLKSNLTKICAQTFTGETTALMGKICPFLSALDVKAPTEFEGIEDHPISEGERKQYTLMSDLDLLCQSSGRIVPDEWSRLEPMCLSLNSRTSHSLNIQNLYKKAAAMGYAPAKYQVAKFLMLQYPFYENRYVDVVKFEEINKLLKEAAMGGSAAAAAELGFRTQPHVLEKARGSSSVTKPLSVPTAERKEERQWACKAAELGDVKGAADCSRMIFDGIGGPGTNEEGVRWLKVAAQGGDDNSCYNLASKYQHGHDGVKKDLVEAKKWHCAAIYFGNQWSANALKSEQFIAVSGAPAMPTLSVSKPKSVPTKELIVTLDGWFDKGRPELDEMKKQGCSKDLISEANQRASEWLEGNPHVRARRAKITKLLGENKEVGKYLLASKDPLDQYVAGRLLEEKYLMPRDVDAETLFPTQYYEQAAKKGNYLAQIRKVTRPFNQTALRDRNFESELKELRELFKKFPEATGEHLARSLTDYRSLAHHQKVPSTSLADTSAEARRAMCKAAEGGSVTAQYECGNRTLRGDDQENKNPTEAVRWLSLAAEGGHGMAAHSLKFIYQNGKQVPMDLGKAKYWECVGLLNGGFSLSGSQYQH